MAVQKFRTFEDARRALWLPAGDPRIVESMRTVWALSHLVPQAPPPRGVRKSATMEEANADRDAWDAQNIKAARTRGGRRLVR